VRRARALALLAGIALLTTGCPAGSADRHGDALPARPTDASTSLPPWSGPPPGGPPTAGPVTALRAAVDLSPAVPAGELARATAAVAAPGGGAYVVLAVQDRTGSLVLAAVRPAAGSFTATPLVPLPRVAPLAGLHVLADGGVALAGRLSGTSFGVRVVDPATGAVRTLPAVSVPGRSASADGRSALAPDGRTLYLFVTARSEDRTSEQLVALDTTTGEVLARRDVAADVARASTTPVGRQLAGLVARPGGGATLVFDASPTPTEERRIPTLLTFDAALRPVGEPVRAASLTEHAEVQAVAGAPDGTVFLLVEVPDGAWVLAVPDGGGAGPVLAQVDDRVFDYALSVEPAQRWAVVPAAEGARAVDLTTGEVRAPFGVDCGPGTDVAGIRPTGDGALLVGQCDSFGAATPMLWLAGP
jgi:hypothetical protein